MIAYQPDVEGNLRRLAQAGSQGLQLGDVPASAAIMLALVGHAEITTERPQRVIVTSQGAAFARRQVFA